MPTDNSFCCESLPHGINCWYCVGLYSPFNWNLMRGERKKGVHFHNVFCDLRMFEWSALKSTHCFQEYDPCWCKMYNFSGANYNGIGFVKNALPTDFRSWRTFLENFVSPPLGMSITVYVQTLLFCWLGRFLKFDSLSLFCRKVANIIILP